MPNFSNFADELKNFKKPNDSDRPSEKELPNFRIKEACEYILSVLDEASNSDYDSSVKKDISTIKKEANLASERAYESFKVKISKNKHYADEVEEFYKKIKSAPKVDKIIKDNGDLYSIYFKYNSGVNHDMLIFYDDEVCRELNKSEKLKSLGYKFISEDYLGIYIDK